MDPGNNTCPCFVLSAGTLPQKSISRIHRIRKCPGILILGYWLALGACALADDPPAAQTNPAPPPATNSVATPVATNAIPHFQIDSYEIRGNSLIPEETLRSIFTNAFGANVAFPDITSAVKNLQLEYHNRGYDTVSVTIPQQSITNGVFKIQVFQGRLAEIIVSGNHHFSSNNVMRALPGLQTNMYLNSKLFQPDLDRANANQDRQIYPEIRPGPETNTTSLLLKVKDRVPLHGKVELNNQSSPGTPDLRVNGSAVYNNLWQADNSLGVQYSYSPEAYKAGNQWSFYDLPLVANYSGFYRMPLGDPESVADTIAANPGSFGYSEATRKFELPPASGTTEINIFASRSTIDTGVTISSPTRLFSSINRTIDQQSDHQDLTVNQDLGFRLSRPGPEFEGFHSTLSGGVDYKTYQISSFTTNKFIFTEHLFDSSGNPFTRVSVTPSPVPATGHSLSYLPLTLRWDANRQDKHGSTSFGLSYSPNLWFSGGKSNLQEIAGSSRASGDWVVLGGSLAREQILPGDWRLDIRADGQWSSEPLISNEQFGIGGVNGVRGYREGEVFGTRGWRVTSEFKTPSHLVGYVGDGKGHPLTVRGSVFMDYAETYFLDPQAGQQGRTPLWGAGFGVSAAVSSSWDARLLFAVPFLKSPTTEAGQLRIAFGLSAQF